MSARVTTTASPTIAIAARPSLQHQPRYVVSMSMPVDTGKMSYDALKRKFFDIIRLDVAQPPAVAIKGRTVISTNPTGMIPVTLPSDPEPRCLSLSASIPITRSCGRASDGVFVMDELDTEPTASSGGEMVPRTRSDSESDSDTDENNQAFIPPHLLVQTSPGSTPPFSLPARRLFNNLT
ncbi:hypothetical protein Pelo_691 [Pelomyxa schiedti]|nr:hypothetical protein Pelo_691 [Pelomyxa schiedti]